MNCCTVLPDVVLVPPVDGSTTSTFSHPKSTTSVIVTAPRSSRADDREEVIPERLKNYDRQTLPVVDYYQAKGRLRIVNGEQPMEEVTARFFASSMNRDIAWQSSVSRRRRSRRCGVAAASCARFWIHVRSWCARARPPWTWSAPPRRRSGIWARSPHLRAITTIPACCAPRSMRRSCTGSRRKSGC